MCACIHPSDLSTRRIFCVLLFIAIISVYGFSSKTVCGVCDTCVCLIVRAFVHLHLPELERCTSQNFVQGRFTSILNALSFDLI